MKVNHFIIGALNTSESAEFYKKLFSFKETSDDPGREGGVVMEGEGCDLLILPFAREKLPNPAHFAFEVEDLAEFENILNTAIKMKLAPRCSPDLNSEKRPGEFSRSGTTYRNFYILDPSKCNVEVMVQLI